MFKKKNSRRVEIVKTTTEFWIKQLYIKGHLETDEWMAGWIH